MTTLDRRLLELERKSSAGLLVLFVSEPPTDEQQRRIEDAEREGRLVVLLRQTDRDL